MAKGGPDILMLVKRGYVRRPVTIAVGALAVLALLGANVAALVHGLEWPWLLGSVVLADMAAIGAGILVASREVLTAAHRTEVSEARLASIVDSAMDAIVTVNEEQRIVLFNRAAEGVFGVRRDDAMGVPLERFLPSRFRAGHREHIEGFGRTGVTGRRMGDATTLWALRANGEEFPIEASISQAVEDGRRYYTVILRDITLRKRSEDALRAQQQELRELSARVVEAREEEKTHIARELHDELGQMLTALKMDFAWLAERLPAGDAEAGVRAGEMRGLLEDTVGAMRRISADLRPLMLDDLGLAEAANWLVQDFARRSGVACEMRVAAPEALQALPRNLATAIYRAVQESLTNVARHSGAKRAWVAFATEDGSVQIEIEDDGRGIRGEDLKKARSLGLKGMRERFAYFGGSLEITSPARGGTRLRIQVPLPREDAPS